jgi:hypothetical protein
MKHVIWQENLLEAVAGLGEEGRAAVEFLRGRHVRIGFKKVRPNIGAFWTIFGNIYLNSRYYTRDTSFDNLRLKTLVVHEAWHLQQGFLRAFSVLGELEAWQVEFGVYHRLKQQYPHPAIAELMTLPLAHDRAVLKRAVKLMQDYAGRGYRSDLLPLYPLGREIKYWLTRK